MPHSVLFCVQLVIGSLFALPLMPIAGASMFFVSYGRASKYWESHYRTTFRDQQSLAVGRASYESDSGNSNAVFYEHLVEGVRAMLLAHVQAGRLGRVTSGDVFLLVNESLTGARVASLCAG